MYFYVKMTAESKKIGLKVSMLWMQLLQLDADADVVGMSVCGRCDVWSGVGERGSVPYDRLEDTPAMLGESWMSGEGASLVCTEQSGYTR